MSESEPEEGLLKDLRKILQTHSNYVREQVERTNEAAAGVLGDVTKRVDDIQEMALTTDSAAEDILKLLDGMVPTIKSQNSSIERLMDMADENFALSMLNTFWLMRITVALHKSGVPLPMREPFGVTFRELLSANDPDTRFKTLDGVFKAQQELIQELIDDSDSKTE